MDSVSYVSWCLVAGGMGPSRAGPTCRSVNIAAHSFGGLVARRYAWDHRGEISLLVPLTSVDEQSRLVRSSRSNRQRAAETFTAPHPRRQRYASLGLCSRAEPEPTNHVAIMGCQPQGPADP